MEDAVTAGPRTASSEPEVREAQLSDLPEILRLVGELGKVMDSIYGGPALTLDDAWRKRVEDALTRRLGVDAAIFVVEAKPGKLAALAAGCLTEPLPRPRGTDQVEGHVQWVATDALYRGRGYASAVTAQLLDWFASRGALAVSLEATPEAESLYRRLGFSDEGPRALSIRLE